MATHTVNIDVIDKTIPIGNNRVIPVINQPNPALGYAASANEVAQLLQLANYYVYEAGTDTIINPYNYYDYFPEAGGGGGGGGGGGVTPQTVQSMIDASIDSTVSDTSTKAVQNAAITNFVNSSIESSTAEFKGTYDSKVEMDAVTANQNDYAFLCVLNNDGSVNHYERYKWSDTEVSGSHWLFEYNVNNSSFTAEQWAAINSGIKDTDVSALGGHVNNTNNPHSVTKAQVGLSDVDNTSDADKPISTAAQTALNTKFDTAGTGLNKNGTTISHATPEGAATHAKAFYKFSTDALGHVNGVTEATETEVNAIDSGITAAKVGQIETNKNNILTVADQSTQYNIVPIKSTITTGNASVTTTVAADKSITIEITGTTSSNIGFEISDNFTIDTNTEYVMTGNPSASAIRLILQQAANPYTWIGQQYNNQASVVTSNISFVRYYVFIYSGSSGTITIKPMLTPKPLYDAGFTEYQPYALSNAELTKNVLWNTQNGVKNLLNIPDGTYTITGLTVVAASGELTFTSTNATAHAIVVGTFNLKAGTYVLSDRAGGGKGFDIRLLVDGETVTPTVETATFTLSADKTVEIRFYSYATISNQTIKPMLCLKSLYDADPSYQPYALPNTTITPALAECVDNGVKNLLDFANLGSPIVSHVTYTKTATDITCTSNDSWAYIMFPFSLVSGNYNLSFVASNYSKSGGIIRVTLYIDSTATTAVDTKEVTGSGSYNFDFTWTGGTLYLGIYVNQNGTSYTNTVTIGQIMICTQAEYNISPTYQPYAMSNADLTPHTANVVKTNFTATDWTKVDELAFEIPTGKIAEFSASATRDTTNLVKGVAFVNDDTFSIDRVLAISENANESYYALAVHGIRSRKNFASETVNVFVKYSAAPVSSSITCTYRFV